MKRQEYNAAWYRKYYRTNAAKCKAIQRKHLCGVCNSLLFAIENKAFHDKATAYLKTYK